MKEYAQYFFSNPVIRFGKPGVTGTCIANDGIFILLTSYTSHQEILEDFPSNKEAQIKKRK